MNPLEPHKAILIIKNNIISVLSLSVQNILEKSYLHESLDDFTPEVINFLNILEHVIYFCVKGNGVMLSQKMKQHPWKLFLEKCKSINNNCIPIIFQLDNLNNNFAKIRAVIRMSLIEKRLHEYLLSAFNDKVLNRKLYTPDSIILSGQLPNIINELTSLSTVNFSFDLKINNNHPGFYPIDYNTYLKNQKSSQVIQNNISDFNLFHNKDDDFNWKSNYCILLDKIKSESKQKEYLEEALLNRETKISAIENRNKILESEITTLESSVTDLQIQLTLLHEQYCKEIERLGGTSSNLINPSLKSIVGSRAEITSDRHPLAKSISQMDSEIGFNFDKGDQSTSPLLQVVPLMLDCTVRDSYNKLSKMAYSTGDLGIQNSNQNNLKDINGNSNRPISEKFPIGKQLISEITQCYYSPSKDNHQTPMNNIHSNAINRKSNNMSDYSSRLFNFTMEDQKTRIMESQELRKIMVKASRSPMIKAHRHAQLRDVPLSLELLDDYSLDESMSDDAMDSLSRIIDSSPLYDHSPMFTNSHNNESFPDKDKQSPNENSFPIHFTNYYYLSSAPVSEELNDDNYFNVDSTTAIELVHTDTPVFNVNNNVQIQSPPQVIRLSPLITAEVPVSIEPLPTQTRNFQSSDNFVNGDRSSINPRNSLNEN